MLFPLCVLLVRIAPATEKNQPIKDQIGTVSTIRSPRVTQQLAYRLCSQSLDGCHACDFSLQQTQFFSASLLVCAYLISSHTINPPVLKNLVVAIFAHTTLPYVPEQIKIGQQYVHVSTARVGKDITPDGPKGPLIIGMKRNTWWVRLGAG